MSIIKEKNPECLLFGDLYFQVDRKYFTEEFFFLISDKWKVIHKKSRRTWTINAKALSVQ